VTLNNYGGTCGYQYRGLGASVADPGIVPAGGPRAAAVPEMQDFQNSKDRPYSISSRWGIGQHRGARVLEASRAGGKRGVSPADRLGAIGESS